MMKQEDFEEGLKLKDEGNIHFKNQDYKAALKCYSRVFACIGMNGDVPFPVPGLENVDKTDKKIKGAASALRVKTFQNIMIIYSKQKNDEKILEKADKILELTKDLDPDDPLIKQKTKALFFRAQVHRRNTDFERCEADLDEASEICNDAKLKKSIESEYELLKKSKLVEEKKYERRMQRAMKRAKKMNKAEVKESAKKVDE